MEQTIPEQAAPIDPGPRGKADSFVDAAFDFLSGEGAIDQGEPGKKKRQDTESEHEEPADDPPIPQAPDPDDDEGDVEGEPDAEDDLAHAVGSRDKPFSIKDLPRDKFIELKVDGEKTVVSLEDLAQGYVREQTFSRRINKTRQLADEAQAAVQRAQEVPKRVAQEFQTWVRDPEQILTFFLATEEREMVLETAARQYAMMRKRFRENPQERLAFERSRDKERLQMERDSFEKQRRDAEEAKSQTAARAQAEAIFKPGWEAGLRKAGFPTPTKDLYTEVALRCQQRVRSGEDLTSQDVETFVLRACRLLELPPATAKKPAPVPAPKPNGQKPRRRDDWSDKPAHERRRDPDYFLKSLRTSDFRRLT